MSHKSEPEILRDRQLAKLREETNRPERFTLGFACARDDRGFRVTFARPSPARMFKCERIDKGSADKAGVRERLQGLLRTGETLRLPVEEIDFSGVDCAWCGLDNGWTRCSGCNALVCNARSSVGEFTCRPSCGGHFLTTPLRSVDAARSGGNSGQPAIGRAAAGLITGGKGK